MRYFSKYLIKDVTAWFKSLRANSISSWIEFSNAFVKYWGEYKSLDSYLADFYALKRERDVKLCLSSIKGFTTTIMTCLWRSVLERQLP